MKIKILLLGLLVSTQMTFAQSKFSENKKWGFKDANGKVLLPPIYDRIGLWGEEMQVLHAEKDSKIQLFDYNGKKCNDLEYDQLGFMCYGSQYCILKVRRGEKWGFFDLKGKKEIIPCKYDDVAEFVENTMTAVKLNNKWGFIGIDGKTILPFIYDDVLNFYTVSILFPHDYAAVKKEGKWGFIDKKGREITPFKYESVSIMFEDGTANAMLNGKWGMVKLGQGDFVPFLYDDISFWGFDREGYLSVKLNDKWGFVDQSGKEVIPCKFDEAHSFSKGKAEVSLNGRTFYIDTNGNEIKE